MHGTIEQLGGDAQKKAVRWHVEGMSHGGIADRLSEEYKTIISETEVQAFIKRKKSASAQVIKEDKSFQAKIVQQYFDTVAQLRAVNSEILKLFYEIRNDPEFIEKKVDCPNCNKKISVRLKSYNSLLKTADHLLNQIKHVDAVLGKMQNKQLNITYNYVDLSKKLTAVMPKMLDEWEKRGLVKVNKKRLKAYTKTD
jgi:hypothetical protein